MLKCTYIIYIHNNEHSIAEVINSLNAIEGDTWREFIFVNDGSTDNSLQVIKNSISHLPRTTILNGSGASYAQIIGKATNLVQGQYIQFLNGFEVLQPLGTIKLIAACRKHQVDVAFGFRDILDSDVGNSIKLTGLLDIILEQKFNRADNIGAANTLITRTILDKIADNLEVFNNRLSLSLECAKHSSFAYLNSNITIKAANAVTENSADTKLATYNNILSIYNFAKDNQAIACDSLPSFVTALYLQKKNLGKIKFTDFIRAMLLRRPKALSLDKLLALYKIELEKL